MKPLTGSLLKATKREILQPFLLQEDLPGWSEDLRPSVRFGRAAGKADWRADGKVGHHDNDPQISTNLDGVLGTCIDL